MSCPFFHLVLVFWPSAVSHLISWRREWLPTPVFLPGKSHGQRSLAGYHPWGRRVGHDWTCICLISNTVHAPGTAKTSIQEAFLTYLSITAPIHLHFSSPCSPYPYGLWESCREQWEGSENGKTQREVYRPRAWGWVSGLREKGTLTWCWRHAHPANERRAIGDPGWKGWPGAALNVGSDPQLYASCAGRKPLTQSAQIWPKRLGRRKTN